MNNIFTILTTATTEVAAMDPTLSMIINFAPFVLMIVALYFFMIRPQKKKEKATTDMRNAIEVGDYITTIGGIMGKVVAVRDDRITLETGADRNKLYFAKWAIQGKMENPPKE